jgi:hypothetical protein
MAKSCRRDVVPSKGDKSGWDVTQPSSKQRISHHKTQANPEKAAKLISPGRVAARSRSTGPTARFATRARSSPRRTRSRPATSGTDGRRRVRGVGVVAHGREQGRDSLNASLGSAPGRTSTSSGEARSSAEAAITTTGFDAHEANVAAAPMTLSMKDGRDLEAWSRAHRRRPPGRVRGRDARVGRGHGDLYPGVRRAPLFERAAVVALHARPAADPCRTWADGPTRGSPGTPASCDVCRLPNDLHPTPRSTTS